MSVLGTGTRCRVFRWANNTHPALDDGKGENGFGSKGEDWVSEPTSLLELERRGGRTRMLRAKRVRPKGKVLGK